MFPFTVPTANLRLVASGCFRPGGDYLASIVIAAGFAQVVRTLELAAIGALRKSGRL